MSAYNWRSPFEGYRVTSPFGPRISPINGRQEWHTGIDLVKAHKSPILAFTAGIVVHAREGAAGSGFGGYGITVAVRDPETDHLHVYAHLDSAAVTVGQRVERGQTIGAQGNTGQSTGSHLHYEIRKASAPQYGWIADRAANCFEPATYLQMARYYETMAQKRPQMDATDSDKIIRFLSAGWFATESAEARAEFNRLANVLRGLT